MDKQNEPLVVFLGEGKKIALIRIAIAKIDNNEFLNKAHRPIVEAIKGKLKPSVELFGEIIMIAILAKVVYKWPDELIIKKIESETLIEEVFQTAEQMGDVAEFLDSVGMEVI